MRTMAMIWSSGAGMGKNPCAACGREMKGKRWAVHVIAGGGKVLHPDDESSYVSDAGEMGLHMVGPECRKKFGEFAVPAGPLLADVVDEPVIDDNPDQYPLHPWEQ